MVVWLGSDVLRFGLYEYVQFSTGKKLNNFYVSILLGIARKLSISVNIFYNEITNFFLWFL